MPGGVRLDVRERETLEGDAGLLFEAGHHRVAELALVREVAVHRALIDLRALGDPRTVSARQFHTAKSCSSSAPAAMMRSRVSAAR